MFLHVYDIFCYRLTQLTSASQLPDFLSKFVNDLELTI